MRKTGGKLAGGPGRGPGRPKGTRVSLAGDARLPEALAPRKRPAQRRSRATVDAVLEAATRLFARQGYSRTNTNDIATRAGVSVGSLYQYFPNKDAILTALLEKHLQGVDEAIRASLAELRDPAVPLREAVHHLLERLQAAHDQDRDLTRAVEEHVGQMPRIPDEFRERERVYLAALEEMLACRPDTRDGNRALMAQLLFEIAETASAWVAHHPAASANRPEAIGEATEAICRYIER